MIPHLFKTNRSGRAEPFLSSGLLFPSEEWIATELVEGALVRVTVRLGRCVRLEVRQRPNRDQRLEGISESWFRDASAPNDDTKGDFWLWKAVEGTNLSGVPDGEWEAMAVGDKIAGNPYQLPSRQLFFHSLIPWRERYSSPIPPTFPMCPVGYDDLLDWFVNKASKVNPDVPLSGVVWWHFDEPVALVKADEFRGES